MSQTLGVPSAPDLPSGTVTFLFTDIEGSTRLWERHPEAVPEALARHDALLRGCIESHGGAVLKTMGDAFCAVFAGAETAVAAALEAQLAMQSSGSQQLAPLRVRMALHTGAAQERDGDYFGPTLNRVARLLNAAHGGQVLLSQTTAQLVHESLPASTALLPMGVHRLKDLQRPEQPFQLMHPDLPAEFPPLRSLEAFSHNLPRQLTSFIGQREELAAVKKLLRSTALLTLTGAGGCGKTRLALQAAADLVEEFPDGVWLVELGGLSDPGLTPQAVRAALGVPEDQTQSVEGVLAEYLRARCLLLVLDNCEHLLGPCATLAEGLLLACPQLKILASSREALGIRGEQTYSVPSLSLPSPNWTASVTDLHRFEAVRLFTDRAALSQSTFTLTQSNAVPVVEICRRLDGIPLAIELAAARMKTLPVGQIQERLDDRFRLLTGGSRTALPRQQTLRALIDWSFDLLSEPERTLLRRLSIFSGGFSLEAAEAVCSGAELEEWAILDHLTALVEKSLAVFEEREGDSRYHLLETVRSYCRESLEAAGEAPWARERHFSYFLRCAEQAEPLLHGAEQKGALDGLERDHDNFRAALEWVSKQPAAADAQLRLAGLLGQVWNQRGYWSEGRQYLERALARADAGSKADRARALEVARALTWQTGDIDASERLGEEWLTVSCEMDDKEGVANALRALAVCAGERCDFPRAASLLEESLSLLRQLDRPAAIRGVLHSLGALGEWTGDYDRAARYYEEALEISRKLDDHTEISNGTLHIGAAERDRGNHAAARQHFETGLALSREVGNKWGIAAALHFLGDTERALGDLVRARALLIESLPLYQQLSHPRGIGLCMTSLAEVERLEGRPESAAVMLAAAQRLRSGSARPLVPIELELHERSADAARAELGETAFLAAWSRGEAMTPAEAVDYARAPGRS